MSNVEQVEPSRPARMPRHAGELDQWQHVVEGSIAVINFVALVAGLALCAGVDGPLRIFMAVFLILLGPGSGLVQLVSTFDTTVRASLVVGLSVAISTLVAQLLLTFNSIGVLQGAIPLTAVTALGLIARLARLANRGATEQEAAEA